MKVTFFILISLFLLAGCSTHTYTKKQYQHTRENTQKEIIQTSEEVIQEVETPKEIESKTTKSYQITMKTKKFAFSDAGFFIEDENLIQVQVYSSGMIVGSLKFYKDEDKVCVKSLCNTRRWFNENFLSLYYPEKTIIKILKSKPIMDSKNIQITDSGFTQNIKAYDYDITYRVDSKQTYFKDRKNRIIIKFRELIK